MRVRERLTRSGLSLTPSEAKIVQILLADFPMAGLGTASALAKRAGVSDPTVARLMVKLGFDGFAAFQSHLLEEVEARLQSPLSMMEAKRPAADDHPALGYLQSLSRRVAEAADIVPAQVFDRAAALVMAARGRVFLLGGRFSRHVAGMLAGYLVQFRSGIVDLGSLSAEGFDRLIDMGRRDLLIVFDYRRYQRDVVDFAAQAAARGVPILLFTDVWMSPVADRAELVIVAPVDVQSPYDTLAPPVGQIEALSARIIAQDGDRSRIRIESLEQVRADNAVTLDAPSAMAAQPGQAPAARGRAS